jgi:hypothetical protein
MLGQKHWDVGPDGQLTATLHSLRLMVRKSDGHARYLVLGRFADGRASSEIMLASGTEPNVRAAIEAAERTATRIAPIIAARLKVVAHLDG